MSRSRKKNPIYTDGGAHNTSKRFANKKVRNAEDIPLKGKAYKKYFESYDIHDWKTRWTLHEAILDWEANREWYEQLYHSFKEYLHHWYKYQRMK